MTYLVDQSFNAIESTALSSNLSQETSHALPSVWSNTSFELQHDSLEFLLVDSHVNGTFQESIEPDLGYGLPGNHQQPYGNHQDTTSYVSGQDRLLDIDAANHDWQNLAGPEPPSMMTSIAMDISPTFSSGIFVGSHQTIPLLPHYQLTEGATAGFAESGSRLAGQPILPAPQPTHSALSVLETTGEPRMAIIARAKPKNPVKEECIRCPEGCRQTFRRGGDFRRHMKKHQAHAFKCVAIECDKTFYRLDKLRDHAKIHGLKL